MTLRAGFSCLLALAFIWILFSVVPKDIETDYNERIDFSNFKTFSWLKVDMPNEAWNERTREDVERSLSEKGWVCVESGADVLIVAMGTTITKTELSKFYTGVSGTFDWYGWGGGLATTVPISHTEGTLIVDIFDGQNKKLIWRGAATDSLHEDPTDQGNLRKLQRAVERMFRDFPPQPKDKKP